MLGLELQDKKVSIIAENMTPVNGYYTDIGEMVKNAINISDEVYVFRAHTHILEESDFINWVFESSDSKVREIYINLTDFDNAINITSCIDKEGIYHLMLTNDIKSKFSDKFKISSRDVNKSLSEAANLDDDIFVDDPKYDQFDFIFSSCNKLLLLTSIHDFNFLVSSEVLKSV